MKRESGVQDLINDITSNRSQMLSSLRQGCKTDKNWQHLLEKWWIFSPYHDEKLKFVFYNALFLKLFSLLLPRKELFKDIFRLFFNCSHDIIISHYTVYLLMYDIYMFIYSIYVSHICVCVCFINETIFHPWDKIKLSPIPPGVTSPIEKSWYNGYYFFMILPRLDLCSFTIWSDDLRIKEVFTCFGFY